MDSDESYTFLTTFFNNIRSQNFEEEDISGICKETFKDLQDFPSEAAIDRAEAFVVTGLLHEQTLLTSYTFKYRNWHNPEGVIATCRKIREMFDYITCDYTNALERYKMCARAFDFFAWMLDGIRFSLVALDPLTPGIQSSIKFLTETMENFVSKSFFHLLIYTYIHYSQRKIDKTVLLKHAKSVAEMKAQFATSDEGEPLLSFLDKVPQLTLKVIEGPRAPVIRSNYCTLPENHPGILTLGTIYSCFNLTEGDLEVAQTLVLFSHTVGISRTEMLFDLFRVGPLIQLKESNSHRNSLVEVFVYLRLPNIIKLLVEELSLKKMCLINALKQFINLKSLLNAVDMKTQSNLVQHLLNSILEHNIITSEECDELLGIRNAEISLRPELEFLLSEPLRRESTLKQINLAEQITSLLRKGMRSGDSQFLTVAERLLLTTDGTMERVCAVMSATDELRDFALRLAKINQSCETHTPEMSNSRNSRMAIFDLTFLLLIRIKYVFKDLRITLTQPELEQSRFFSWWDVYEKGLLEKSPMTTVCENKEIIITQYNILKQSKPFWNDTDEVGSIIDNIPAIGDLILEDFRRGWPGIDTAIENCLAAFQQLPCIFVCFVQWLETQTPITDNIRDFSRKVHSLCLRSLPTAQKTWTFAIYAADPAMQHLISRTPDSPYHAFLITVAHQTVPKIHYMQAPDELMLKDAYSIASQQGWASPDVMELCKNAAQTGSYKKVIICWIQQLLKNACTDELVAAAELILATAFLIPTSALAELNQQVAHGMLEMSRAAIAQTPNQTCSRVMAWLVVRAQTLLIYAEQIRREKHSYKKALKKQSQHNLEADDTGEPPSKMARMDDEEEGSDPKWAILKGVIDAFERDQSTLIFDDDKGVEIRQDFELDDEPLPEGHEWALPQQIHKIHEKAFLNLSNLPAASITTTIHSISLALRVLEKQLKVPVLRAAMIFSIHVARELARVPRSRFWYKLVYVLAKPQFFQNLARIEPFALALNEKLRLYDIRDPEQLEHLVYYACLLRRFGAE